MVGFRLAYLLLNDAFCFVVADIASLGGEAGQLYVETSTGMATLRTGVLESSMSKSLAIGIQGVATGSYTCVAMNGDVTSNFTVSIQAYG